MSIRYLLKSLIATLMSRSLICLFAMLLILSLAASGMAQVTALRAGRLVDPASGAALQNQVLLIEAGKIKQVGTNLPIPAGATVVDLSAETVVPGLFDCQTHLCLTMIPPRDTSDRAFYEALLLTITEYSTGYRALQGAHNGRDMLFAGFTTVRDVGNAGNYADTDLRLAVENGLCAGPTIVNAGRIIAPFGGQIAMVLTHEHHDLSNSEYLYADTHDELIKAVRMNILYGAKLIKLVVDDQPYIYSVEDIKLVVAEAAVRARRRRRSRS